MNCRIPRRQQSRPRQRGMNLIELMIALVIGLVVSLAIFSTLTTFEGRKRSTTSVNDINQTGNYAAYVLDKRIRSAGSGFAEASGAAFGCKLHAARNGSDILPRGAALPAPFASVTTGTDKVFNLFPLVIVPGGTTPAVSGHSSDVLIVMGGNSGLGETSTELATAPTATTIGLNNTRGFNGGDQILVADLSSAPTGTPCMIEEVAANFVAGAATVLSLTANSSNASYYYKQEIASAKLTSFTDIRNGVVFNLGNVAKGNPPTFMVLGVGDNNTLMAYDLLENQNPSSANAQLPLAIADGVFEMHALYGVDTTDDGKIDSWVAATGDYAPAKLTAGTEEAFTRVKRIKAVHLALIMRTSLPEKEKVNSFGVSACSQANDSITYFCDYGSVTRALSDSEQYFRYRVVETTIPLRNAIMVSSK